MKYSDFGVTCAEELEQDDWSRSKPTYNDGKLKVIGINAIKDNTTGYRVVKGICHCEDCAKDSELFGEGIFSTVKHNLTKGVIPCGCSTTHRWSKEQREVQIQRACKQKDFTFIGWKGDRYGCDDRIVVRCNVDEHEWDLRLLTLINKPNAGCPCCSKTGFSGSKPSTMYLVKWLNENTSFLKFGITNRDYKDRIHEQHRRCFYKFTPEVVELLHVNAGNTARLLETKIKQTIETNIISKDLFPDGYTETTYTDNLEVIQSIIKEFKEQT